MQINFPKINIIFRACDFVVSANNIQQRPFHLSKTQLIQYCFKSLYNALQGFNYSIQVVGDKVSKELEQYFLQFSDVEYSNGNYGNDASIRECINRATKIPDDEWVYFCEDDYLHTPDSILKILTLINEAHTINIGKPTTNWLYSIHYKKHPSFAIFPNDYPDRYRPKEIRQHFIFHTSNSHWRQVSNITFTFIMQARDVKKHYKTFIKCSEKANDALLSKMLFGQNKFHNKMLCLSPLPSITAHMHHDTLPPLLNVEAILQNLNQ